MLILVINSGSTSIKYTLFKQVNKIINKIALVNFIKKDHAYFFISEIPEFSETSIIAEDFESSLDYLLNFLITKKLIKNIESIHKFGIRIVHGGHIFTQYTIINQQNLNQLISLSSLAPLHNPPAITLIQQILAKQSNAQIYGVFDTSFHQTIKNSVSWYAIPRELSEQYYIKKYGFHGIVCQSVLRQLKTIYPINKQKIIICHLGGGDSVTAILNGQSIDTSMGFTPMEGLMMISRAGDTDDGVLNYLANKMDLPIAKIIDILNNESGIYGITKIKDMKTVIIQAMQDEKWCTLAVEMFVYRVCKYIFAYYGFLQGLDLLVFSGGMGEHSEFLRQKIIDQLNFLNIIIDPKLNKIVIDHQLNLISTVKSKVKIIVATANEDEEILWQIL